MESRRNAQRNRREIAGEREAKETTSSWTAKGARTGPERESFSEQPRCRCHVSRLFDRIGICEHLTRGCQGRFWFIINALFWGRSNKNLKTADNSHESRTVSRALWSTIEAVYRQLQRTRVWTLDNDSRVVRHKWLVPELCTTCSRKYNTRRRRCCAPEPGSSRPARLGFLCF